MELHPSTGGGVSLCAVFIEPAGQLKDFVAAWKRIVTESLGDQPYVAHPPHSTLIVAPLRDVSAWAQDVRSRLERLDPFLLETTRPMAFYDDPSTNGGHTLAVTVLRSPVLAAMQEVVAAIGARYLDRDALPSPSGLLMREPFLSSYRAFGFPFVGGHWIPHFSVASLRVGRDHPLLVRFLATPTVFSQEVAAVSLWLVKGDLHECIETIGVGRGLYR